MTAICHYQARIRLTLGDEGGGCEHRSRRRAKKNQKKSGENGRVLYFHPGPVFVLCMQARIRRFGVGICRLGRPRGWRGCGHNRRARRVDAVGSTAPAIGQRDERLGRRRHDQDRVSTTRMSHSDAPERIDVCDMHGRRLGIFESVIQFRSTATLRQSVVQSVCLRSDVTCAMTDHDQLMMLVFWLLLGVQHRCWRTTSWLNA